ncbi:MAG: phosphoribosylformylglycinamidine cyclo-ligase [Gammaproteobacteria bacterium]|nr:phosphoribosylformylglycinamidine cyclo-ligase [Gammaproteobacteria bacterium]
MSNPAKPAGGLSYKDAGVDIDAGNELVELIKPAVKKTLRPEVLTGLGGFGGLFGIDVDRYRQPVLVSGTDGVGTKLLLARMLEDHSTIGIDLVAMCVNDILACGAEPLFFLDYFATGRLETGKARTIIEGIAEGCLQAGCALIGGETAEMPGMYDGDDYDLAGFAVGIVERDQIVDGRRITPGHRLIGLRSSGPHSNGYSLIRKVLEVSKEDPSAALVGANESLGRALLAPTRIYVKSVRAALSRHRIDGIAHITGGGLTENISRVLPAGLGLEIEIRRWQKPAVFDWLQRHGRIEDSEMLRTFNCGIGMVLVTRESDVEPVIDILAEHGEEASDIGRVVACAGEDSTVNYL